MNLRAFLGSLMGWAVGLSAVLVGGAAMVGGEGVLAGAGLGAALGCLNLGAMAWLGSRAFGATAQGGRRWAWALALAGKFALFLGLVGWVLWALPVDPLALVVGLGGPVLALVVAGLTSGPSGPSGETGADRGRTG